MNLILVENEQQQQGLRLVKKPVASVRQQFAGLREGSTGRVIAIVPQIWAVAEQVAEQSPVAAPPAAAKPGVELAFYRKYTEAMLRRYLRLSMEAGRVPSLMGKELFRGHVSHYQVSNFEDVVIFCMDVERCLARLTQLEKDLIRRVGLQAYSQAEAAALMGLSLRTVHAEYSQALDRLTRMLLDGRLLEPLRGAAL